ncbi:MAG: VWA domain-containing protein, partial [Nanoarchaeota archaeon]
KASIRARELLIREYAEERNLQIVFFLDVSSSMSFASVPKLKNEYAAELIASLTYAMLEAGDQVGLVMFTDKIVRSIPPNSGARQFYTITKALSDPKLYDGSVDFSKALRYAGTSIKQNTIIIMVSDFIGLGKDWESPLRAVAQRSEFIGIMVRDPFDLVLPDVGQVVISDPFSEHELVLNTTALRFSYALETRRQIESLRKLFSEINSDLVVVTTNKPFTKTIVDFFGERKKKWR